jgi:hypothetical protein
MAFILIRSTSPEATSTEASQSRYWSDQNTIAKKSRGLFLARSLGMDPYQLWPSVVFLAMPAAIVGGVPNHSLHQIAGHLRLKDGDDRKQSRLASSAASAQRKRAQEPGRSRQAQTPWQIPWRGRKDILWRTYEQIGEDRLLALRRV